MSDKIVLTIENYKDSLLYERDYLVTLKLQNNTSLTLSLCILPTVYYRVFYVGKKKRNIMSSRDEYKNADLHPPLPSPDTLKPGESMIFKYSLAGRLPMEGVIKTKFIVRICNGIKTEIESKWISQKILSALK